MKFRNQYKLLPDRIYIQLMYYYHFHKFANLKNPKTFSEKMQWLKLYDRRPEYTIMVDKYAVKDYVAKKIGAEYVIPTFGVWNRPDEIDYDSLPNQFVLKWNHDSKSVVICKDKRVFNKNKALGKLQKGAEVNGYWYGREWPYKNVRPVIIAEEFLTQEEPHKNDLIDYKFFCFNGVPKFLQVIQDRSTKETIDIFDMQWNKQEFIGLSSRVDHADVPPQKPVCFDKMVWVAQELSKDIPFSRIDLYCVNKHIYFGEITLYPASGLGMFRPEKWNTIIGDMIELPQKNVEK